MYPAFFQKSSLEMTLKSHSAFDHSALAALPDSFVKIREAASLNTFSTFPSFVLFNVLYAVLKVIKRETATKINDESMAIWITSSKLVGIDWNSPIWYSRCATDPPAAKPRTMNRYL